MKQSKKEDEYFPEDISISFGKGSQAQILAYKKMTWIVNDKAQGLRYGDNPDQPAALYRLTDTTHGAIEEIMPKSPLVSNMELLKSGKHLSKTNITDIDSALHILRCFDNEPVCVIVKHNNPCGAAKGKSAEEAYQRAHEADHIAAYGGSVAFNTAVTQETAERMAEHYVESVFAPEYDPQSLVVFAKKKNIRVCRIANMSNLQEYARYIDFHTLMDGGIVAQLSQKHPILQDEQLCAAETMYKEQRYGIERNPTSREKDDMRFAWIVGSTVTSNAVLYVKNGATIAIGAGGQDRVGIARATREKAIWLLAHRLIQKETGKNGKDPAILNELYHKAKQNMPLSHAVMASDGFFPFRDGVDIGLEAGVSAVIQPGGSIRDYESITACNEYNATMVFTGQRAFYH